MSRVGTKILALVARGDWTDWRVEYQARIAVRQTYKCKRSHNMEEG